MLRARMLRLNPFNPPDLRMKSCWRLWNAPPRGLTCNADQDGGATGTS